MALYIVATLTILQEKADDGERFHIFHPSERTPHAVILT